MTANAVAKRQGIATFAELFKAKSKNLTGLIPRHLTPERVAKIAISALMRNPKLLQCKPETVWFQVAQAATLGLEVNLLGAAYLVPFKNNKTGGMDCQLIVGYQGLIDLARRSGNIESIEARIVYEKDDFELENGLDPVLRHKPCLDSDPGKIRLVYAVAKLKDGGRQIEYMTKTAIDKIRNRSNAANSGPWVSDYDEMARKTVIRRLAKYLPKSIEMAQAMALDDAGDAGEPQLAGLDIEDDAILADASVIPEEESETDKLKSELKSRKKDGDNAESVGQADEPVTDADFTASLAKLSLNYDGNEKRIDGAFSKAGLGVELMDIKPDCADENTRRAVIAIAKGF